MMNKPVDAEEKDQYANSMDWGGSEVSIGSLSNYRKYQYDLIGKYIGTNVLEVGSGASRSFTRLIVENVQNLQRLLSIEPSATLLDSYEQKSNYKFPPNAEFKNCDIFDLDPELTGKFDTVIFVHVLEHIEHDRAALDHVSQFLNPGGRVLIEVPAIPALYSVHDENVGHWRRYTKKSLRQAINTDQYRIKKMWYNDAIGILGSFYYFKLRKISLNENEGIDAVKSQGQLFDKYLVPVQKQIERILPLPIGLSLNAILEKI